MEILTSVRRLYISFKSLVNDFVYSFGRAALLLLVEVQNHTVPVRERRRIRVNGLQLPQTTWSSFKVHGPVHHKYIPFDIFPTRCNITQFIYFWKTALHVSGGISTHHQEHT